jgi:predicted transcriptional regulator of viral defense system
MSAKAVDHRIKEGRLHPVHRGVYAVGHRRIIVKGRWMAAVLACGPRAALSHTGAAAFYDLRAVPSGPVHVTVPTRSGLASRPGITVHRSRLAAGEAVVIDAVRVTTVSRTLLDLGDVLTLRALRNTLRRAEVLELFDLAALQTQIARHRHRAGAAVLKHALGHIAATATPADRNWLERRLAAICRKHGLPLPEQQVMIGPHTVDFL